MFSFWNTSCLSFIKEKELLQWLYFSSGRQNRHCPVLEYPVIQCVAHHLIIHALVGERDLDQHLSTDILYVMVLLPLFIQRWMQALQILLHSLHFLVGIYDYLICCWFSTVWYFPDVSKGVPYDKTPFINNFQKFK